MAKIRVCDAWFCPEEFSDQGIYDLQQESAQGRGAKALAGFKRAVLLDPASAYRWADLGESTVNAGFLESAEFCFQRALAAGPRNPAILFRAANFYFRAGNYPASLRNLRAILSNPELSEYYLPSFVTFSRMDLPIHDILETGIPQKPFAAQAFLRFLMQQGRIGDSRATWKWISERCLVDGTVAAEYVRFLILKRQLDGAADQWEELNQAAAPEYRRINWVFNGSFESPFRPSPLDWHIEQDEDVHANRVNDVKRDGRSSLELVFAGDANVDYHQIAQQTVLKPGKWRLLAFIRTDALTTDQGVSLRLYDALQPQHLDVRTYPLTGTHDWTKVERVFTTRAKTTLVQIEIMRQPSLKIDSKIAGKAWIDAVELRPDR